jgi:hypothetical protein
MGTPAGRGGDRGAIGLALGRVQHTIFRCTVSCCYLATCMHYALLCSDVCRASECRGLRGIAPPHRSLCRAVSWACEELDLDPASRAGGGAAEGARHCYSRDARLIRVQDISLLVCFSCMRIAELLFRISFILAECFFCGVIFG